LHRTQTALTVYVHQQQLLPAWLAVARWRAALHRLHFTLTSGCWLLTLALQGDLRKISAVYYLNRGWREDDGGQLMLTPTGAGEDSNDVERVSILPELDRLVCKASCL
jgi:hypothetical protein